jgi:anti-sigma factor (TIGR02949 family)
MDDCRRTAGQVTPYVDGDLPEDKQAEVARHLDACPPCRRGAEQELAGRTVLRECADRLKAEPIPPGLRSRCESLAREHTSRPRVSWFRLLVPLTSMAVLIVVGGVMLFSVATRQSDALLAAQLTADHVKCFKVFEPNRSVEAERVEQELDQNYGWDMHVPPTSSDGTLVGGRRCLYADGSIAHVMYRGKGTEPVSLFRLDGVTREPGTVTSLGHQSRIWSRGGHTYVLVTPERETPEILRLARYVQAEAR